MRNELALRKLPRQLLLRCNLADHAVASGLLSVTIGTHATSASAKARSACDEV